MTIGADNMRVVEAAYCGRIGVSWKRSTLYWRHRSRLEVLFWESADQLRAVYCGDAGHLREFITRGVALISHLRVTRCRM